MIIIEIIKLLKILNIYSRVKKSIKNLEMKNRIQRFKNDLNILIKVWKTL